MTSAIADSVLAVTHKLVGQAMRGEWHEVPKTVEERRVLLNRLDASASPADQQWLVALRQAMAESDKAVAQIAAADAPEAMLAARPADSVFPAISSPADAAGVVDATLDMIRKGR
jgi:hypothetical protein